MRNDGGETGTGRVELNITELGVTEFDVTSSPWPRRQSSQSEMTLSEVTGEKMVGGAIALGEIAGSKMAPRDKVVDFTAWRRARLIAAPVVVSTNEMTGSAEIVPIFTRQRQRQMPAPAATSAASSLPVFDYRGGDQLRAQTALPPELSASVFGPAVPGGAISAALLLPSAAGQRRQGANRTAASRNTADRETNLPKDETRPIGKWHRGLAWFVNSMAGGVINMDNLQAILTDMQDELDALETSMQRLRDDDDLELVDLKSTEAGPALRAVTTMRRTCDITGHAVTAEPAE